MRSVSERAAATAAEEQALQSLDHPSQLARANALQDILNSGDPILRDAATQKVAASTDKELKAVLLRWLFARSPKSYLFSFDECGGVGINEREAQDRCNNFVQSSTGRFPLVVKMLDPADGSFLIYSQTATEKDNQGAYQTGQGKIVGDRIEFSVNLYHWQPGGTQICSGSFQMKPGATMAGRMQCGRIILAGNFSVN